MSLGVWFDYDIQNILISLYQSTLQSGVDGEYRRGYEAALVSTALAFGIELPVTQLNIPRRAQSPTTISVITYKEES